MKIAARNVSLARQGSSRLVGQSNFAATHIPPSDSPSNPMHLHHYHPHHASPLDPVSAPVGARISASTIHPHVINPY